MDKILSCQAPQESVLVLFSGLLCLPNVQTATVNPQQFCGAKFRPDSTAMVVSQLNVESCASYGYGESTASSAANRLMPHVRLTFLYLPQRAKGKDIRLPLKRHLPRRREGILMQ